MERKLISKGLVVTLSCAVMFLAASESSLSIRTFSAAAQMQNQTNGTNSTGASFSGPHILGKGIGNEKTIPKIANLGIGNNTKIIMNNKNIGNPNSTLLKGMEKSQLGNVIPGNQGTTFEGQQLANLSSNPSNSSGSNANNMTK